jgi:hypothetical protein
MAIAGVVIRQSREFHTRTRVFERERASTAFGHGWTHDSRASPGLKSPSVFATLARLMRWNGRLLPVGFTSGDQSAQAGMSACGADPSLAACRSPSVCRNNP